MSVHQQHDVGAGLRAFPLFGSENVLTKSSNDTTEITGIVIDRLSFGRHYLSAKVCVPFIADTQTSVGARFVGRLQHATSTAAGDFAAFGSTGITRNFLTTTTATSTGIAGVAEFDYDLRTARRFLRFLVAPSLVASSSGLLSFNGLILFGGPDEAPSTQQGAAINAT